MDQFGQDQSVDTVKEFANNPFNGKDLMMTPEMPLMDSPEVTKKEIARRI